MVSIPGLSSPEQLDLGAKPSRRRAAACRYFINESLGGFCTRCGFPRAPHVAAADKLRSVGAVESAIEDEKEPSPWAS